MVEGAPLLRVHPGKTWIQGSNPCVSASKKNKPLSFKGFFLLWLGGPPLSPPLNSVLASVNC